MLKMVKANLSVEFKADISDEDDLRERLYDKIYLLLENEELSYEIAEENEDLEDE